MISQCFTNSSTAALCIIVEPWAAEYTVKPGSTFTVSYPNAADPHELSPIVVTDEFIIFWCAGDAYKAEIDGQNITQ